ncbi:MAG: DegT/DnrJ/EryC1/StrS family aminotransferase, partial [Burkholderiales bacterium]|nr:DegT/DnrJ/EryC1/StrS family aminotransferase [Burkholderiales bacterium]
MHIRTFDYLPEYRESRREILAAIEGVLESGSLILGNELQRFEHGFAEFLGGQGRCVGVNSGTDALAIALRALGIGLGDEVVTVANTAVATVSAIRQLGAIPVFC